MSVLEIILILIFWIGYGYFAAFKTKHTYNDGTKKNVSQDPFTIFYIFIAPLILLYRMFIGAFIKNYKF